MVILDTNVISELMRNNPTKEVVEWLDAQPLSEIATTAINLAEAKYGLARLPVGRRRGELELQFNAFVARGFAGRVFDFDAAAAETYGETVAARERSGRPFEGFDGLIAAIAKSRGFPIATRNLRDFAGCGVGLINPWQGPQLRH